MCGIAGIIGENKAGELKSEIRQMTEIIVHRGPDDGGYYYDPQFAFGHRRLSILDLSVLGKQPMEFMDKYVIIFNGEIYNYIELKKELIKKGYIFRSNTDTEIIMAAYDCWGKRCLDYFNGMWSFAIYDKDKQIIFCSRDRFGVKPFYYSTIGKKFVFASEIKQFTIIGGWKAVGNIHRIIDFLDLGLTDHTNETLFKNVFQLRGGEYLEYDLAKHSFKINKWYDLQSNVNTKTAIAHNKLIDDYKNLFIDSVHLRMRSDVKVGSCLSGGLDSSSIVCVVNNLLQNDNNTSVQETVSSCFTNKQYDEQLYIDEVVAKTNVTSHKVFPCFEDLFEKSENITWHQDEPFYSTSIFAQWNVFKMAKENNILVMLDGQGADEQLAGYKNFYLCYYFELIRKLQFIKLCSEILSHKKIYPDYFLEEKIISFAKKLIKKNNVSTPNKWLKIRSERNVFGRSKSIQEESIKELLCTSLPKLLHYEDRNSMANSVESRVPFLDYRLVEYTLNLPSKLKINKSVTKFCLRRAMVGLLPDKIINRYDKLGFVTPEEMWIREHEDIFRNELLNACNLAPALINKNEVMNWFNQTLLSNKRFDYVFWKLISFGHWMRIFNVSL